MLLRRIRQHLRHGIDARRWASNLSAAYTKVAQYNHKKWRDPAIQDIVSRIRTHYFPPLPKVKSKGEKEDTGLLLPDAIKSLREAANADGSLSLADFVFEAKCRLAGENANGVRGVLTLTKTMATDTRILVFCAESLWREAKAAGATYVGGANLIQDVIDSKLEFNRCIATLDQMPVLTKLARVLGPRGLMPNVKTGTLTTDVIDAIGAAMTNIPFKIEKETALFNMAFARPSFTDEEVMANLKVIMKYLQLQNKTTEDGSFIESAQLSIGSQTFSIAKSEYGQVKGPKFMTALERLRAQIADRKTKMALSASENKATFTL